MRLAVIAARPSPLPDSDSQTRAAAGSALIEHRPVWFPETGFVETPILDRALLPRDGEFVGPAIVEQMDTTLVVPVGARIRSDPFGNLIVDL